MQRSNARSRSTNHGSDKRKVYVKGLATTVDDEKLQNLFKAFGSIESCHVVIDHETKLSRGFGFVVFQNQEQAELAVNELNQTPYEENILVCKLATNTTQRQEFAANENLYVRNLPPTITETQLRQLFHEFADELDIHLLTDSATKKGRGIGFIRFKSIQSAVQAQKAMDGKKIEPDLPPLFVRFADPNHTRGERRTRLNPHQQSSPFDDASHGSFSKPQGATHLHSPHTREMNPSSRPHRTNAHRGSQITRHFEGESPDTGSIFATAPIDLSLPSPMHMHMHSKHTSLPMMNPIPSSSPMNSPISPMSSLMPVTPYMAPFVPMPSLHLNPSAHSTSHRHQRQPRASSNPGSPQKSDHAYNREQQQQQLKDDSQPVDHEDLDSNKSDKASQAHRVNHIKSGASSDSHKETSTIADASPGRNRKRMDASYESPYSAQQTITQPSLSPQFHPHYPAPMYGVDMVPRYQMPYGSPYLPIPQMNPSLSQSVGQYPNPAQQSAYGPIHPQSPTMHPSPTAQMAYLPPHSPHMYHPHHHYGSQSPNTSSPAVGPTSIQQQGQHQAQLHEPLQNLNHQLQEPYAMHVPPSHLQYHASSQHIQVPPMMPYSYPHSHQSPFETCTVDPTNLFIFHLPPEIDEDRLDDLFSKFGQIESKKVVRDYSTGESRGYGFVRYFKTEDAKNAMIEMDGFKIGRKTLKVSYNKTTIPHPHYHH